MDSPARRTVSLPIGRSPLSSPDPQIEILFNIPWVRVVSFTTSHGSSKEVPSGLSWKSPFESTIAVGPLRIYRAPGSVAFLSCASALRPILPKSQCWVVDEESSKFVLFINPPKYWRIEVPNGSEEERERAKQLKEIFAKVLLFERTPCPFQRSFTIDLPDPPQTPIRKKRPWRRPEERPKLSVFQTNEEEAANTEFKPDVLPTAAEDAGADTLAPSLDLSETKAASNEVEGVDLDGQCSRNTTVDTFITPRRHNESIIQPQIDAERNIQPKALHKCHRSITAPPLLSLVTCPPSKQREPSSPRTSSADESDSDFSAESFHTVQHSPWHSPLDRSSPPASPSTPNDTYPYPHDNIALGIHHSRETSELTITPQTPKIWDPTISKDTEPPSTPPSLTHDEKSDDEERSEVVTPPDPRSKVRHRATTSSNSRRRALSPLPAAVNLFTPPRRSRHLKTARHLPIAIIQKTCEILLSPPSHLLHLMLNIASKIAAGEWRGMLSGYDETVHWDLTEDEYVDDGCTEDDYGIILPGSARKRPSKTEANAGSWEVD